MAIQRGYLTLAEAKRALDIVDNVDDQTIERLIETTSRMIDNHCGRTFVVSGEIAGDDLRRFTSSEDGKTVYLNFEFSSLHAVRADYNGDGVFEIDISADVEPGPLHNEMVSRPWNYIFVKASSNRILPTEPNAIEVDAVWSWLDSAGNAGIPEPVKTACAIQLGTVFRSREAVFGVIGSNETGMIRMSSRLHPEAQLLLDPYRRRTGLAV